MSDTPTVWERLKRKFVSPDNARVSDREITQETISRDLEIFRESILDRRATNQPVPLPVEPLIQTTDIQTSTKIFDNANAIPAQQSQVGETLPVYVVINGTIYEMSAVHRGLEEA